MACHWPTVAAAQAPNFAVMDAGHTFTANLVLDVEINTLTPQREITSQQAEKHALPVRLGAEIQESGKVIANVPGTAELDIFLVY